MLFYSWPAVFDVGPTIKQRWVNASYLLGVHDTRQKIFAVLHAALTAVIRRQRLYYGPPIIAIFPQMHPVL